MFLTALWFDHHANPSYGKLKGYVCVCSLFRISSSKFDRGMLIIFV